MKKVIVLSVILAVCSGCSSIMSKHEYAVVISSTPDAANFVIKNRSGLDVHAGVTPETVVLKSAAGYFKGETYTVSFKKEGFAEKEFVLQSTVDGWYFGNILVGGLLGMLVIDPATGAMYNLPSVADVTLEEGLVEDEKVDAVTLTTIDTLSAIEKNQLVRID